MPYSRRETQDGVTVMNKELYDNLQDGIDELKTGQFKLFSIQDSRRMSISGVLSGRKVDEVLYGSSVYVAQIVNPSRFINTIESSYSVIADKDYGTVTVSGTNPYSSSLACRFVLNQPMVSGHWYILYSGVDTPQYSSANGVGIGVQNVAHVGASYDYTGKGALFMPESSSAELIVIFSAGMSLSSSIEFQPMLIDLTQMFGEGNEAQALGVSSLDSAPLREQARNNFNAKYRINSGGKAISYTEGRLFPFYLDYPTESVMFTTSPQDTIHINYLYKIGDVADSVNLEERKFYRRTRSLPCESMIWSVNSSHSNVYQVPLDTLTGLTTSSDFIMSGFKQIAPNISTLEDGVCFLYNNHLCVHDSSHSTLESFESYLSSINSSIYFSMDRTQIVDLPQTWVERYLSNIVTGSESALYASDGGIYQINDTPSEWSFRLPTTDVASKFCREHGVEPYLSGLRCRHYSSGSLDDIKESGAYFIKYSSITGKPAGMTYGLIIHMQYGSEAKAQIAINPVAATMFFRAYRSTWSAWKQVTAT